MAKLSYVRLYTRDGKSYFEDVEVELKDAGTGSAISDLIAVKGLNLRLTSASEYNLDWHPASRRQFVVNLTGEVDIEASGGETRRFGPGTIMLAEDTTGQGHKSRGVGEVDRVSLFVHLPE